MTRSSLTGPKMPRWIRVSIVACGALLICAPLVMSQKRNAQSKRVAPPKFDSSRVDRVFFPDIFKEVRGERPTSVSGGPAKPGPGAATPDSGSSGSGAGGGGGSWSKVIVAATIEDEVKAIKRSLDDILKRPPDFKSRGYLTARTHFTTLATMFAVIQEYDGEIRWKKTAPVARDFFSRVAANCKTGSTQTYQQAKLRRDQLMDVVNGSALDGKANPQIKWGELVDRSPLMQRLEVAQREILEPAIANKAEFTKQVDKVRHEAEIMAVIAAVLKKDGMDDAGDEGYDGYAKEIEDAAAAIVKGVKQDNYETVRTAVGKIGAACSNCHDDYKG